MEPSKDEREAALREVVITEPNKVGPLRSLARLSAGRLQQIADFFAAEVEEDRRRARQRRSRRTGGD